MMTRLFGRSAALAYPNASVAGIPLAIQSRVMVISVFTEGVEHPNWHLMTESFSSLMSTIDTAEAKAP